MPRKYSGVKKGSLFRRMLLALSLISVALVLVLSTVLYFNYMTASVDMLNSLNTKVLSQISYSITYMDDISKNYCKSFYLDNNASAFIWANDSNIFKIKNSIISISSQIIPNPYIDSVYLYNGTLDLFVNIPSGSFSNSKEFSDRQIADLVKEGITSVPALTPIARTVQAASYGSGQINVYTYFFYDVSNNPYKFNGMVVVNVRADWLRNIITALSSKSNDLGSEILVLDQYGHVMSSNTPDQFAQDLSGKDYVSRILKSQQSTGTFSCKIQGKAYVISYVSSDNPKWHFISLTPADKAFAEVHRIGLITIGSCLFMLLLGIVYSLLASRRLYNPINSLVSGIRKSIPAGGSGEKNRDEIDFLSMTFTNIYGKTIELETLVQDKAMLLKEEYYRGLLTGTVTYTPEDMLKRLSGTDIRISLTGRLFLLVIRLDSYDAFIGTYNEKERAILRYAVSQNIQEAFAGQYYAETLDMGEDHFTVLINVPDEVKSNSEMYNSAISILLVIQGEISNKLNLSVSAAMGSIMIGSEQLHRLYLSTLDLSLYRFVHGHRCILTPEILVQIRQDDIKFPTSKEKIMIESLRSGNSSKAAEVLNDIYGAISLYPYEKIQASLLYLCFVLYNSFGGATAQNGTSQLLNSILTNMGKLETLNETKAAFLQIFSRLTEKNENKKIDSLVNTIVLMIKSGYANRNLCLNSIADSLDMSSAYIGRVFREATSMSVAEYLTDFRMEMVGKLLDEGTDNINEIIDKTGLDKSSYFYTTFRKHFGVSLSEYKSRLQRQ